MFSSCLKIVSTLEARRGNTGARARGRTHTHTQRERESHRFLLLFFLHQVHCEAPLLPHSWAMPGLFITWRGSGPPWLLYLNGEAEQYQSVSVLTRALMQNTSEVIVIRASDAASASRVRHPPAEVAVSDERHDAKGRNAGGERRTR